jgi:hypothetical protein
MSGYPVVPKAAEVAITVTFGSSDSVVDMRQVRTPATVVVAPGAGCTVRCQYSTTANANAVPGSAIWRDWPAGSVTTNTSDTLQSPVIALRFQRTGGSVDSTGEVIA